MRILIFALDDAREPEIAEIGIAGVLDGMIARGREADVTIDGDAALAISGEWSPKRLLYLARALEIDALVVILNAISDAIDRGPR